MTRLVFLDFDGVLNSNPFLIRVQAERRLQGKEIFFDPSGDGYMLDTVLVARLNRIIEATGAKVVISSSWRLMHDLDTLRAYLREAGFVGEIIGATPRGGRFSHERGDEIRAWLEENGAPESFVILDDIDEFDGLRDRHVHTNEDFGLEDRHVEMAIELLVATESVTEVAS